MADDWPSWIRELGDNLEPWYVIILAVTLVFGILIAPVLLIFGWY